MRSCVFSYIPELKQINFFLIKNLTITLSKKKQYRYRKMKSYTPSLKKILLRFYTKAYEECCAFECKLVKMHLLSKIIRTN